MPSKKIEVAKRTAELIDNPDFSDWSIEELVRGQRKSRTGRWHGKPPKVIPLALLHELNRRVKPEVHKKLLEAAAHAAEYLRAVAAGEVEGDAERTKAAMYTLNRLYGMPGQHVHVELEHREPTEYEKAGVQQAVVIRDVTDDALDVESHEVDPWEQDDPDPFGTDEIVHPSTPAAAEHETGNPVINGRPTRIHKRR